MPPFNDVESLTPRSPTEEPPVWATSTALQNYALTLGLDTAEGDEDSADESQPEGQRYRVVAAAKSSKLEIKECVPFPPIPFHPSALLLSKISDRELIYTSPAQFLTSRTLHSTPAKQWLSTHLSASASLFPSHPAPPIYMLTGLILMTHATHTTLTPSPSSQTKAFIPGTRAPFDPTGVTALRRSSVSEHVRPVIGLDDSVSTGEGKKVEGVVIHETGKYPGTRGWAARWERVGVRIAAKGEGGKSGVVVRRKGTQEERIAEVELEGVVVEDGDEEEDERGEEFWDQFLDVVEEFS